MIETSDKSPDISVILPVHNGAQELHNTVDFILRQTFKNFEVLIIDDGSTDKTWDIMQILANADNRIRIFKNDVNQGIVRSMITLVSKAMGAILIREDCGDLSDPKRYEQQHRQLADNPDASACVSDYWLVDVDNTPMGITQLPTSSALLAERLKISNCVCHSSFAMRKSAYEKVGGYDKELKSSEDYEILLKLLKVGPIVPVNKPLVAYKFNPNGLTFRNLQKMEAYAKLAKSRHIGGPTPEFCEFEPISIESAEVIYHQYAGKLHLVKGRNRKAREHFKKAISINGSDTKLILLEFSTYIPGGLIRTVQKLRGRYNTHEMETPFYVVK